MNIQLLAVGKGMPTWVEQAYREYQKRLPPDYRLELIEVAAIKRSGHANLQQINRQETEQLLQKVIKGSHVIALERRGQLVSSHQLADRLLQLHDRAQHLSLLIGGPEGLDLDLIAQYEQWSLSHLTLPHPMVRVILAEQIYRGVCILKNHPYHR